MSINNLLPDPREVSRNDISTFYDLRQINMQYKFGRITATEAMAQVDKRIKKHDEDYDSMYKPFYDALRKGDNNND